MILNSNFSPRVESVIIWNSELANWFVRNQEWLAYFELTHSGCLHFENSSFANNDVRILGRMANAAYRYIELNNDRISELERADLAVQAMTEIYEQNKELLSKNAKKLYAINRTIIEEGPIEEQIELMEELKECNESESFTRVLSKHNGTKNRRPGKGHRNH
ncbi:MAG: hypothetical protein HFE04_03710 [Bacilli bacterium]|nr:hypothetical protein [Bacilli bacterium]